METKERVVEVVCLSISMAISEYSVQQVLQKYPRANQIRTVWKYQMNQNRVKWLNAYDLKKKSYSICNFALISDSLPCATAASDAAVSSVNFTKKRFITPPRRYNFCKILSEVLIDPLKSSLNLPKSAKEFE